MQKALLPTIPRKRLDTYVEELLERAKGSVGEIRFLDGFYVCDGSTWHDVSFKDEVSVTVFTLLKGWDEGGYDEEKVKEEAWEAYQGTWRGQEKKELSA